MSSRGRLACPKVAGLWVCSFCRTVGQANGAVVEIRRQRQRLIAAIRGNVGSLPGKVAFVASVDRQLLDDGFRDPTQVRP